MEAMILAALVGVLVGILLACWRLRTLCAGKLAGSRTLGNVRDVIVTPNVAGGPGPRPD
jgi:hypothetical protein